MLWLVAWDFPRRPRTTFYDVLADEFNGDIHRVQKSVALCQDDFSAARLSALLEYYGASVLVYRAEQTYLPADQMQEASEFVDRVHAQRLHRRGRLPSRRRRR